MSYPTIYRVSRSEWGCSAETDRWCRDRVKVAPALKTEIHVHHTAAVDGNDQTPNRWTFEEAAAYMRSLEWARPDLGPLPYSENIAVAEDLSAVWVLEGRGILELGAHTGGHNIEGVGWGILGNFDLRDDDAAALAVEAIRTRARQLRADSGLINLGEDRNPRGWMAWGHRDTAAKSCPGKYLYPLLEQVRLDQMFSDQDREELHAIIKAELLEFFGPAYTGTGPNAGRRFIKAIVDSVWHARSSGRKTIETLDEIHDELIHAEQ